MPEKTRNSDGLPPPATTAQLQTELLSCLRPGITVRSLAECPQLIGLELVRAKSASTEPQDRAVAARDLIAQTTIRVDGQSNGATATLLALATGTRGTLLKERRPVAAQLLHISPSHLRTSGREDLLMEALADELFAADSAYRLRNKHRDERERQPAETRLGVDWLDRHQAYRRVWTPVNAISADLAVLLDLIKSEAEAPDIVDRLLTICWRWAKFQLELDHFVRDYGGLWLLGDIKSEFACADAVYRIDFLTDMGAADNSWLRLRLQEAPELTDFCGLIYPLEDGQTILHAFDHWARSCECQDASPDIERCEVHGLMAAVAEFTTLLDQDWIAVADWYRLTEKTQLNATG